MEQGWVYVLVNSSLPGFAKVGRTSRPAAERAAELSAATGVPTPFVVAFDQPFEDCWEAERQVHSELDRRGLRVAANREFFRGAPSEMVRVIIEIAHRCGPAPPAAPDLSAERFRLAGDNALFGQGDTLQDTSEALRCYKLASARGSLIAYERIGHVYGTIYGSARNRAGRRRALTALKEGARRGNYYCYCELAALFSTESHLHNFAKSWDLFFARRADSFLDDVEFGSDRFIAACTNYISQSIQLKLVPGHLEELREQADAIMAVLLAELDRATAAPARQAIAAAMRWAFETLPPPLAVTTPARRSGWRRIAGASPWMAASDSAAA